MSITASPSNRFSLGVVILLAFVIIASSFSYNKVIERKSNVITWDVYGYYLYLPATFIYHDTKEYRFTDGHLHQYHMSSDIYQLNPFADKVRAPAYTMGLAILWSPFFLAAYAYTSITHTCPADGLSFPYQLAVVIASWFYMVVGLSFLRKALLRFFDDKIVAFTLFAILLGTNYFHYACYEAGMPHAILFALYGILIYCIILWHDKPTLKLSVAIGALMGIACLARPSECVTVLFFLLFGITGWATFVSKTTYLRNNWKAVLAIIIAGIVAISPQVLYWHFNIGQWFYNGYAGHTFQFFHPHLWVGTISYRKGWLLYTPLMVFALLGLFTNQLKQKGLQGAVASYFAINIYIVLSWHMWWYASSFGCRALVQSYAFMALPFAAFTATVWQQKWSRYLYIIVVGCMLLLNQFQDWQYRHRILPFDLTSRTYYWEVFGKTSITDRTIKRYLDVDEKLPPGKTFVPAILTTFDAGDKPIAILTDSFGKDVRITIDSSNAQKLSGNWLLINSELMSSGNRFEEWHEGLLVLTVDRQGQSLKWTGVRFQQYTDAQKWNNVHYEIKLPKLQTGDVIKGYLWNRSPDTLYYKAMDLQLLQPQQ